VIPAPAAAPVDLGVAGFARIRANHNSKIAEDFSVNGTHGAMMAPIAGALGRRTAQKKRNTGGKIRTTVQAHAAYTAR
jgi:hypothetical protein